MSMWELASTSYRDIAGTARDYFSSRFTMEGLTGNLKEAVCKVADRLAITQAYTKTLNATRRLRYSDGSNEIRQYETVEQIQFANTAMERFIVAMPEYRNKYNRGRAAGYEDGFSNFDKFRGNAYANTDANFRAITSGMSTPYDDNYINTWDLHGNDNDITNVDRVDVQIVWSRMSDMDWEDSDPGSSYGGCVE